VLEVEGDVSRGGVALPLLAELLGEWEAATAGESALAALQSRVSDLGQSSEGATSPLPYSSIVGSLIVEILTRLAHSTVTQVSECSKPGVVQHLTYTLFLSKAALASSLERLLVVGAIALAKSIKRCVKTATDAADFSSSSSSNEDDIYAPDGRGDLSSINSDGSDSGGGWLMAALSPRPRCQNTQSPQAEPSSLLAKVTSEGNCSEAQHRDSDRGKPSTLPPTTLHDTSQKTNPGRSLDFLLSSAWCCVPAWLWLEAVARACRQLEPSEARALLDPLGVIGKKKGVSV